MRTPILVTAFGTTEKAFQTYDHMDKIFKEKFNDHPVIWAYSSRVVKTKRKKENKHDIKDPIEVLIQLKKDGYDWVTIQSLHIIWGHEFQRLVTEALKLDIRFSMGLPLLTSVKDYEETAKAVASLIPKSKDEAAVFVGHGTDHPAWTSYPVFGKFLRNIYGPKVFTGVLEGYPGMDETIAEIEQQGFKKVTIIPFMLVAGMHFNQNLTKKDDSWQKTFERHGITVNMVDHGLGELDEINNIFVRHISEAFDAISQDTIL
jgi:sirohydrochlorin cobaltochelatase